MNQRLTSLSQMVNWKAFTSTVMKSQKHTFHLVLICMQVMIAHNTMIEHDVV